MRRGLGDEAGAAGALTNLGVIAFEQGDLNEAEARLEEALELDRAHGNEWGAAVAADNLAAAALERGDWDRARELIRDTFASAQRVGDQELLAFGLEKVAVLAALDGKSGRAGRLAGVADVLRDGRASIAAPSTASGSIATSAGWREKGSKRPGSRGEDSSPTRLLPKLLVSDRSRARRRSTTVLVWWAEG